MFVADIFESFHGEVNGHHQGRIVTFIRLSGCNLRCSYCDTKETWDKLYGENLSPLLILNRVKELGHKHVCITGGEPLLDKAAVLDLMHILSEEGYRISVETNGTISITPFVRFVDSFIIDWKIPPRPFKGKNLFLESNLVNLRNTDIIKFVVMDEDDVILGIKLTEIIIRDKYKSNTLVAFSPIISEDFLPKHLANALLYHKAKNCILSVQIHKLIDFK